MEEKNICFFETYYGGSHKSFADGLVKNSNHDIKLYTLPEKNYKWRIRGSALYLIENDLDKNHDLLLVSDMFNVADYKAIRGKEALPVINYFHENQITYPHNNSVSDFSLGMINITSALCSDKIIFNSHTHYNEFIKSIPEFLERAPDHKPHWVKSIIEDKSSILYPGCNFDKSIENIEINDIPLIIWNHRWDYDKKPESFFHLLRSLKEKHIDFKVALLGFNYENKPKLFKKAEKEFKDQIVFSGFAKTQDEYTRWLKKGDIVISTAIQENFGYSIVEATHYGCFPILPNRLSYPEIIPEHLHDDILYNDINELISKATNTIKNIKSYKNTMEELSTYMKRYSWNNLINRYDEALRELNDEN